MHRINNVCCANFGMIGFKWEKRSLSPRYTYCPVLDLSFRTCYCECFTVRVDTIYVTDCTVIAWLSVSNSSAIFLAVCAIICGIEVFIFTTMTNSFAHRSLEQLELFRFLVFLYTLYRRFESYWHLSWVTCLIARDKKCLYLYLKEDVSKNFFLFQEREKSILKTQIR